MPETGLMEFTVECEPGRKYFLAGTGLPPAGMTSLRYTASTDPDKEPGPVSTSSALYSRWFGPAGFSRPIKFDKHVRLRFLLSTDAPGTWRPQVTWTDEFGTGWMAAGT